MATPSYWSKACSAQADRPLWQHHQANYGSSIFTVSICASSCLAARSRSIACCTSCLRAPLTRVMQIVSFVVAALYSGMWFLRWARAGAEEQMWAQLGWFSSMICVGSVTGTIAWGARLQYLAFYYESHVSSNTIQQHYTLLAPSHQWLAVFLFFYGVEFLCFIIAELILLGQLANSAAHSSRDNSELSSEMRGSVARGRALPIVYRVMAGGGVVGSVAGMVASAVAGAFQAQAVGYENKAADVCGNLGKNSTACQNLVQEVVTSNTKVRTAQSVQFVSEALTLLLLSISFIVIVSWSVALFRLLERISAQALRSAAAHATLQPDEENAVRIVENSMQAALQQRRRLTTACVIVLITFPARAAFDLLSAYSAFNAPLNSACQMCDSCQSQQRLVRTWITYTPQFQAIVVALCAPLPLMMTLWLITKAHAQNKLIAADVQLAGKSFAQ